MRGILQQLAVEEASSRILEHMAWRTATTTHAARGQLDELRHMALHVEAQHREMDELGGAAASALRSARYQLTAARQAVDERLSAYESCKEARSRISEEQHKIATHEKEARDHEVDRTLEAKGDLDLDGERDLVAKLRRAETHVMVDEVQTEACDSKLGAMQEQFKRLRLALHDPSAITSPDKLAEAMLGMEERKAEIEAQVARTQERIEERQAQHGRLEEELQTAMYAGGANSQAVQVERPNGE